MAAFARNATGLVRSMGFLDQFLMSMSMVNVTGFVFSALAAPYYFPGSNLILIYVLGVIPAFAIAIMYGILSAAIPRSGGDYIWTGRILGPRFATVLAVMLLVAGNLAYLAMNLFLIVGFGLAQLFVSLGLTTSNSGYISIGSTIASAPTGYILSLIFMLIVLAVGIVGIDFYKKTLRYTFVFYIFSAVLFVLGWLQRPAPTLMVSMQP